MPTKREYTSSETSNEPRTPSPIDSKPELEPDLTPKSNSKSMAKSGKSSTPKTTPKKPKVKADPVTPSKGAAMPTGAGASNKAKLAMMIVEKGIEGLDRDLVVAQLGFTTAQLTQLIRKDKGSLKRALMVFAETL